LRVEYAVIALVVIAAASYYVFQNVVPEEVAVTVILTDSLNKPVENATVQLFADDKKVGEYAAAGGRAVVRAAVKRGALLMVRAEAPGFITARSAVRRDPLRLVMQQETTVRHETDFVILTDLGAVERKYGAAFSSELRKKIFELAYAAESNDRLESAVVFLGENYSSVGDALSALSPSYLLIVGGPRIVPFGEQETPLKNAAGFGFIALQDSTVMVGH